MAIAIRIDSSGVVTCAVLLYALFAIVWRNEAFISVLFSKYCSEKSFSFWMKTRLVNQSFQYETVMNSPMVAITGSDSGRIMLK
ncbi:hypothetical protein D3C73_1544630 [compost metagenome]